MRRPAHVQMRESPDLRPRLSLCLLAARSRRSSSNMPSAKRKRERTRRNVHDDVPNRSDTTTAASTRAARYEELRVKRERAASPNLSARPAKKVKTELSANAAATYSMQQVVRHTRAHDARPQVGCLVCFPHGVPAGKKTSARTSKPDMVRHTRAHDAAPHPGCPVCYPPATASAAKARTSRGVVKTEDVDLPMSPTPSLQHDLPSSDFDCDLLTPLPDSPAPPMDRKKEQGFDAASCTFSSSLDIMRGTLYTPPRSRILSTAAVSGAYSQRRVAGNSSPGLAGLQNSISPPHNIPTLSSRPPLARILPDNHLTTSSSPPNTAYSHSNPSHGGPRPSSALPPRLKHKFAKSPDALSPRAPDYLGSSRTGQGSKATVGGPRHTLDSFLGNDTTSRSPSRSVLDTASGYEGSSVSNWGVLPATAAESTSETPSALYSHSSSGLPAVQPHPSSSSAGSVLEHLQSTNDVDPYVKRPDSTDDASQRRCIPFVKREANVGSHKGISLKAHIKDGTRSIYSAVCLTPCERDG